MALKAPKGNAQRQFAPQKNIAPGTYPARPVQLIDYGLQPQKPYAGKEKNPVVELGVTYELVDEFMKDEAGKDLKDKPRWISETFPLHPIESDKARSTQRYLAFDPTNQFDGDFTQILDKPINVTIVNNKSGDKVYDNVATISAMRPRDAENCPKLVNAVTFFSLDEPDLAVFNGFPKWIQDKIKGNLNFNGSPLQKLLGDAPVKEEKKEEAPKEEETSNNPY